MGNERPLFASDPVGPGSSHIGNNATSSTAGLGYRRIDLRREGLLLSGYWWSAPGSPLVILLHGFPDVPQSLFSWAVRLRQAGFAVLVPTMRGYEPSSQRVGAYGLGRLTDDVLGWLDRCGADTAHLVGHDWGAAVGYCVAGKAPQRITSLTTLAVPHMRRLVVGVRAVPRQLRLSWYMAFFQTPVAGHALARDDFALLERLWRTWSPGWTPSQTTMANVKRAFKAPGVVEAALGYYRALTRLGTAETREDWRLLRAPLVVPTLALTGADDGCMATELYDFLMPTQDRGGDVVVERVAGAGHWLHLERPDVVQRRVLEWLCSGR